MSLLNAAIAKIKQDKLNVRRTVLSTVDQNFINEVAAAAEAEGIELDNGIRSRAQKVAHAIKLPTSANTKAEIHAFMDEHEIEYESDNNKDTLLKLVDTWKQNK